ncbi:MAG TPA: PQQ-binding-like beta-propeller repeat protein [Tepidisphaeraceae bacterium]|jgi:outer membrane protein assembly factor BamB
MTLSGAALVGLAAGTAGAQVMAQRADIINRGGAVNPESYDAKDASEGVYAPESVNAMDQLAKAQKMERQKEWGKSADFYQELLTSPEYATKVVPSREDANHRIYQYTSVEELVMQRLSRWPQEGLDVYRARYEAPADTMLQQAKGDDLFALQQVFTRYFVTDSGKAAGLRLMDHYLEAGEFRAAAAIGERLLKWHPNVLTDRAALQYRLGIAYHLAGDEASAKATLEDLRKRDPQARGTIRGKDVPLVVSLAEELSQAAPVATGSTSDSYTTFGGDASRDRILAVSGTPGAHLYSIALSKPTHVSGPQAQIWDQRYKQDVQNGMTLGVMPVVDRGELFFQDGERIYGLNLESGVPLPGWLQAHGPDHDGAYALPNVSGSARTHQLTVSVTDRAVLAVMGQQDPIRMQMGLGDPGETRLVCLDRETGKENWVVAPSQFKQASLKQVQFSGSPLVVGDSVFLVGSASKQAGFEDCIVMCFDLSNGTMRWNVPVASASTVAAAWAGFNPNFMLPINETHLAYANGRVYVQTNRGAVAALDAYNGTIDWLDIYQRNQQAMMNPAFNPMVFGGNGQFQQTGTKPWAFNPVIVSQGMVFTLPLEGKHLLIYDAAGGQEFKRIDLSDLAQHVKGADIGESDQFDVLVGVEGDKLLLAGSKTLVLLNWKTYDEEKFTDEMFFWVEPSGKTTIRGRPLLTSDSVYFAAEDRFYHMQLKTGLITDTHPDYPREWDEGEGPGNVLVTSDHAIIAGADAVDVYTDLAVAKRKLDREVAEAPNDPQPRLRYAEIMYAAGDYDTSVAKLDEAIQRLGGADAMQPGAGRDRVFNDALTFAQRLKADERPEARKRVEALFDRASEAALTPEQKVQYRIARGKFDELRNELPDAIKLYQEVLADPALRAVPLPDQVNNTPTSADVVARKQIGDLIAKDPQLYEPFERQAADALKAAQETNDPAKLLDVAQAYPNSSVATKASLAAADAYETSNDVRAARHVLSDLYFDRNQKSPDWPRILEAMARTDPRTAAHMLAQGVEQLNNPQLAKPLKLPNGQEIAAGTPFSVALEQVRKFTYQQQDRTLSTFNLPIPQPQQEYPKPFRGNVPVIDNVDVLVVPLRDFARPDRVVTWSATGTPALSVYPAGASKALASSSQITERPLGCAWVDRDLLVWGPTQAVLLKGDGADLAWRMEISRLAPIDVVATDQAPEQAVAADNNNNINIRLRNRMIINAGGRVIVRNGMVMPAAAMGAPAAKPVHEGPEQIDTVVPVGDRILLGTTTGRVVSLETANGRLAWQTRLSDRPADRLLADGDFTVIKAEDETYVRLAVLDTFTGHVRGSKTWQRDSNSFPQNLALSPDGTLVYTLPDRICLKDLYKPWDQRGIERPTPQGQWSFNGLTGQDQLVIAEGRILALTDSSGDGVRPGEKFVRLYSLETGEPIMLNFNEGQQVEKALSVGSKSPDVTLRVVGPRVYMVAPDAAICYNLEKPDDHYQMFDQETEKMGVQASFIGKDYVVLLSPATAPPPPAAPDPNAAPGAAAAPQAPAVTVSPTWNFYAFRRQIIGSGKESGVMDYSLPLADPAGITSTWQPMEGGLVYLTADHKLHMLLGAKD